MMHGSRHFLSIVVFVALFSATLGQSAEPPSPDFSGRLFANLYVPYGTARSEVEGQTLVQSNIEAWLTGAYAPSETFSTKGTFVVRSISRPRDQIDYPSSVTLANEFVLREGYARYAKDGMDFQAGRIMLPWGKADAINPTDYFSGKDYRISNPDEEVRRVAPVALVASITPKRGNSSFTITGVAVPIFARSTFLIPSELVPAGANLEASKPAQGFNLGNMEYGLKFSYAGTGWDISLSGFSGWNHLADLGTPTFTGSSSALISPKFQRMHAIGADLSWSFNSFVIRSETSYRHTADSSGGSGLISPSYFETVLGADRPIGDHFRVQLQGYYRWFPVFTTLDGSSVGPNTLIAPVVKLNALLQGYQYSTLPGATGRVVYANEALGLEAELFVLAYFPQSSAATFSDETIGAQYLVRPKVTYRFYDDFSIIGGFEHFSGPASSSLGAARTYRSFFAEAKYVF